MQVTKEELIKEYRSSKAWEGQVTNGGQALLCTDLAKFRAYIVSRLNGHEQPGLEAQRIADIVCQNFSRTVLGYAKLHIIQCLMSGENNPFLNKRWGR